ncbi:flavin reductase family protein [Cupriavidus lacunae]|uniref:Flavin reductase family protein n=1 Tax=Cupriavidus lacunae TaxID=2666307 RepID=A0A370P2B8_9BURK|nr:flavin reductase family protein [Cupriavidus lacunae]RDK11938.1 flavin reductase family protein [Cupriavidus lacunae]
MQIKASTLSAEQTYRLLTGIVVPRPIAWVTSVSADGIVNLAPFSAFTFVSAEPPMLAISIGRKGNGYKDTAQNILNNEEYVIHIADSTLMAAVHDSSAEHPPEVSEVKELGLETLLSTHIGVPRLALPPIAMECRLRQCLEFGDSRSRLIVGEVLMFHIRDGLVDGDKIDTRELDPLARVAGPRYGRLGDIVTVQAASQLPRPNGH